MNAFLMRAITSAAIGFPAALTMHYGIGVSAEQPQLQASGQASTAAVTPQPRGGGMQFTEPSPIDFNDHAVLARSSGPAIG